MNVTNQQNKPIQPYKCLDVGRRHNTSRPPKQEQQSTSKLTSLFDPKFEKAACGVGFIVNINGQASRKVSFHE